MYWPSVAKGQNSKASLESGMDEQTPFPPNSSTFTFQTHSRLFTTQDVRHTHSANSLKHIGHRTSDDEAALSAKPKLAVAPYCMRSAVEIKWNVTGVWSAIRV